MKTLEVYPTMTLVHLLQHVHELFPYLQVEPTLVKRTGEKFVDEETINDSSAHPSHCRFLIGAEMTIAEFETKLQECFNQTFHVKRWSGYSWHETDDTRDWTLERHNHKGAESILSGSTLHR